MPNDLLPSYFTTATKRLRLDSENMREAFKAHHPSVGTNREQIVASFLRTHLPARFGVGTGMIFSSAGIFANQSDVVIYDALNNQPFHADSPNQLFAVESVLAVLEVKSSLSPSDLRDSVQKCVRFKTLKRSFGTRVGIPRIKDTLFMVWAFDAPSPPTVKENYVAAVANLAGSNHPDFVIVPHHFLIRGGSYREIALFGQPGSEFRKEFEAKHTANSDEVGPENFDMMAGQEHLLLAWFVWVITWMESAVPRSAPLEEYVPEGLGLGEKI